MSTGTAAPPVSDAPATAGDLSVEQADLRERARRFVDEVLIPNEVLAETSGGKVPEELIDRIRRESIEAGLSGGLHAREHGGQGWSRVEWFLVEEQLGRTTNALSWYMPGAYNVLKNGTEEQIERYLKPALRGELHDAYAVTEADAGSDPSRIETTATKIDGGWRIDGEKWFVTYGDVAAVYIVMANANVDGERRRPSFWSSGRSRDQRGRGPPVHAHLPARPPDDPLRGRRGHRRRRVGGLGGGDDLQRAWFTEERLGNRGARRRLDVAADRGGHRVGRRARAGRQPDPRLPGHLVPARRLRRRRGRGPAAHAGGGETDRRGADPKVIHAKASMAKLFVSEASCRCADRAVQAFGGRGYMRTNVAERFNRELRVDRIWEGTSEIQRLIVARALERRGVERTLH